MSYRIPVLLFLLFQLPLSMSSAAAQEVYPLTKLLLADSEPKVLALPPESGGGVPVYAAELSLFDDAGFRAAVVPFIGQPISNELLNGLIKAINEHAQKNDRLIAKVLIPTQDITRGTLRFVVLLGRYNELMIQGNRWFSKKLLEERLGLKPGDEIRLSTLEGAVNWANTNPFREVKVMVSELPNEPGKANLVVGVKERVPFRAIVSIDDTGNQVIGEYRLTAAFQHGNLWGLDHLGSYQYITTKDTKVFQAHALDYRIPLRWRHFLQLSGSYVTTHPLFGDGLLLQTGKNISSNLRYTVPLRTGNEPRDVYFGVSYKHGNNNLEFDPELTKYQVFQTNTDTFQLFAGFSNLSRDKRGAWAFAANVFASPGNINSRNTDEALQAYGSRIGASASYVYGNISVQRLQKLGTSGWDVFSRATLQAATSNIVTGEHLSIGGSATVRGYDENIYAAEQGFVFGTDVMTPEWKQSLPFLRKTAPPLQTRFTVFYDAAQVEYKHRDPSDIPFAPLASTGIGLRSSLGNNFSFSADYGWQLTNLPQVQRSHARGHVKLVLAF